MNYKAVEVIWIFSADTRTDGQTDRGVPRGPRGPKKSIYRVNAVLPVNKAATVWAERNKKNKLENVGFSYGWLPASDLLRQLVRHFFNQIQIPTQ